MTEDELKVLREHLTLVGEEVAALHRKIAELESKNGWVHIWRGVKLLLRLT